MTAAAWAVYAAQCMDQADTELEDGNVNAARRYLKEAIEACPDDVWREAFPGA